MKNKPVVTPFTKKVVHIAIVVKDANKAIKRLESFGIGPFKQVVAHGSQLPPVMYRGKPMGFLETAKEFTGEIGGMGLEIFEPGEGESPWGEFLDSKGEGIHHIGFEPDDLDDLDKEIARFSDQGADVLFSLKSEDGTGGGAYIDLGIGGLTFDYFLPPKGKSHNGK